MDNHMWVAFLLILVYGHSRKCADVRDLKRPDKRLPGTTDKLKREIPGPVKFDVNPKEIMPSFTKTLTTNCTFKAGTVSDFTNLLTISISRSEFQKNQSQESLELVSINIFYANQVNVLADVNNASLSGHIDSGHDSYLSLQWSFPSGVEAGLYQCEARSMDDTGHFLIITESAQVTTRQPNLDELINKLSKVQFELEQQEQRHSDSNDLLKKQIDSVETAYSQAVDNLDRLEGNYNKTVSALQADLSELSLHYQNISSMVASLRSLSYHLSESAWSSKFKVSDMYNGHFYLLSTEGGKGAVDAVAICEQHSGYLTEIDDVEEYTFIQTFLNQFYHAKWILLGGTDEASEGTWVFRHSGRPVVFTAWNVNQPGRDAFDCMAIYRDYHWKMYEDSCTSPGTGLLYLCEVPLV